MAACGHIGRVSAVAAAVIAGAIGFGCKTSWTTETAQPPLNLGPDPVGRTSLPLSIQLSDMHLPRRIVRDDGMVQDLPIVLPNTAYLVVVNEDRIRARVRLMHRWKEMTDLHRWKAWLETEEGRPMYPSAVEKRASKAINQLAVPEYDRWTGRKTGFVYRIPVNIWDGGGDYVFYKRELFNRDLRRLTLVLQRRDYEFRYTWHFVDGEHAGSQTTVSRGSQSPVTTGS